MGRRMESSPAIRAGMFGTAIILVSLASAFLLRFSTAASAVKWFQISKTFMSNFLISGIVCAQIVLAEKLAKPDYSCGVPRIPNPEELKPWVRFQESFATSPGPGGQESLRLVPPFHLCAKRWITDTLLLCTFCLFLISQHLMIYPLMDVH